MTFTRLRDCDLPGSCRPLAFQCDVCRGISFHLARPSVCPYCEEDE